MLCGCLEGKNWPFAKLKLPTVLDKANDGSDFQKYGETKFEYPIFDT